MKKQHLRMAAELAVNLCLPWLAYTLAEPRYGEFGALLVSSVPPLLWSLGELAWHRRIDALSMLVLAGIALSALAMALGGDARLLLLRESLISGLIGLIFLASLLLKRPLVYFLARATVTRQNAESGASSFHSWWQNPPAQRAIRGITAAWGLGLTSEAALRTWMAFHWPTERVLAIAPALGYLITGGLGLWTFWRVRSLKNRRADAPPSSVDSE